jgi:hypothetical protein
MVIASCGGALVGGKLGGALWIIQGVVFCGLGEIPIVSTPTR